jgi:hypothetical protein
LNDTSCAVELPTQLDTELMDVPPLTPAAQDGVIFQDPLYPCFQSKMAYIAMGKALNVDLAGLGGGIDDVEDMLDDEDFLQLSRREASVPATFIILDFGQQNPD